MGLFRRKPPEFKVIIDDKGVQNVISQLNDAGDRANEAIAKMEAVGKATVDKINKATRDLNHAALRLDQASSRHSRL